jgi:methylase of polypeptide subunit release factors
MTKLALAQAPTAPFEAPPLSESVLTPADRALLALGQLLREGGYRFTTITPASHHRVAARKPKRAGASLVDVFGWSRSFQYGDLPDNVLHLVREADALDTSGPHLRSKVRFSTLDNQLFVHSAFPTEQGDAVFFGPDTYRFGRALRHSVASLAPRPGMRILDIGAGSGAGGLYAAGLLRAASPEVILTDINHTALRFCRINALLNDVPNVQALESDLYDSVDGACDLIVSNPPYLVDPLARLYRHGGGSLGSALSVSIVEQGIERLARGGRLLLYTGSAIVDGADLLHESLRERLKNKPLRFSYEEIDPDVFGEELEHAPYDRADRIAVVVATIDAV